MLPSCLPRPRRWFAAAVLALTAAPHAPAAAATAPPAPGSAAVSSPAPMSATAPGPAAAAPATAPGGTAPPVPPAVAAGPVHPLRASAPAFGGTLEIEVRDLPREAADAAIQAAAAAVGEVERTTDPGREDGELGALNAAAGKGARHVEPRLFAALVRALNFCIWSNGKEGPLGRDLYRLWGQGAGAPAPSPADLGRAVEAANCKHLVLDLRKQTATLAAGSALDLADFRTGMAIDRAIEVLRQQGSGNALVQIGAVRRAIGAGRDGHGWRVELPPVRGAAGVLGHIYLRDHSLAIADPDTAPSEEVRQAPLYLNQRNGRPAGEGILVTLAVTELAVDAEALAATMTITGTQEGELLTGSIRPRPSILWLMGNGTGIPVMIPYRWDEVPRR